MNRYFCDMSKFSFAAIPPLVGAVSPYDLVMHHQVTVDEYIVMVCDQTRYAVCRIFPSRKICTSPNFHISNDNGLLGAPLSAEGLRELLQWIDRKTAIDRFVKLSKNPVNHPRLNPEACKSLV